MKKKSKPKIIFPVTYRNVQKEVQERLVEVEMLIDDITKRLKLDHQSSFERSGGCKVCRGRGWIITWDSLSSGDFTEYGQCSESGCTEETRKVSGLDSSWDKYDGFRGTQNPITSSLKYHATVGSLNTTVDELNNKIVDLQNKGKIENGSEVVIMKGRKAPIGFQGRIFWISDSQWGTKVGLINDAGVTQWTYMSNVEKIYDQKSRILCKA